MEEVTVLQDTEWAENGKLIIFYTHTKPQTESSQDMSECVDSLCLLCWPACCGIPSCFCSYTQSVVTYPI